MASSLAKDAGYTLSRLALIVSKYRKQTCIYRCQRSNKSWKSNLNVCRLNEVQAALRPGTDDFNWTMVCYFLSALALRTFQLKDFKRKAAILQETAVKKSMDSKWLLRFFLALSFRIVNSMAKETNFFFLEKKKSSDDDKPWLIDT